MLSIFQEFSLQSDQVVCVREKLTRIEWKLLAEKLNEEYVPLQANSNDWGCPKHFRAVNVIKPKVKERERGRDKKKLLMTNHNYSRFCLSYSGHFVLNWCRLVFVIWEIKRGRISFQFSFFLLCFFLFKSDNCLKRSVKATCCCLEMASWKDRPGFVFDKTASRCVTLNLFLSLIPHTV